MRTIVLLLLWCFAVFHADGQVPPSSNFFFGDTTSQLSVNDFFADRNGTVYAAGQYVKHPNISLYIAAVRNGLPLFTHIRTYGFDEKGYFIRPYDSTHIIVCGHSEDTTGTFNVRLLKMTRSGTIVWDTTFGNNGESTMEMPNAVEVDPQGNIIVGGISFSSEVKYLLVKFSADGTLLWSIRSAPFAVGNFTVRDILIGPDGSIYGVTNNSFITDTSHGTVFRWDPSGNVLWSRNFDLSFYEERGRNLALSGDTLIIAGTPWVNGQNVVSFTAVMLRTNGDLLAYRNFPLYASQQGIRDLRRLADGSIVVLDETYVPPLHRLHTIVLSRSLIPVRHDSVSSSSPLSGSVVQQDGTSFTVLRYGALLSTVRYTYGAGTVVPSAPMQYDAGGREFTLADNVPPFLYAVSKESGAQWERMRVSVYNESPLHAEQRNGITPSSPELFHPFPNPFNPSTTLSFRLSERSAVELAVFDLLGRKVAGLFAGTMEVGTYSKQWRADDLAAGPYCVRLTVNGTVRTARILLLK
jgi:hypothetical protein